jgi:hypothetical protein
MCSQRSPPSLTSGRFIGREQDRGIVQFAKHDGAKEIPCAISTSAMDDPERGPEARPATRLRDRIEACAGRKYQATEFEGTPPGIVLRSIDFRG